METLRKGIEDAWGKGQSFSFLAEISFQETLLNAKGWVCEGDGLNYEQLCPRKDSFEMWELAYLLALESVMVSLFWVAYTLARWNWAAFTSWEELLLRRGIVRSVCQWRKYQFNSFLCLCFITRVHLKNSPSFLRMCALKSKFYDRWQLWSIL